MLKGLKKIQLVSRKPKPKIIVENKEVDVLEKVDENIVKTLELNTHPCHENYLFIKECIRGDISTANIKSLINQNG